MRLTFIKKKAKIASMKTNTISMKPRSTVGKGMNLSHRVEKPRKGVYSRRGKYGNKWE